MKTIPTSIGLRWWYYRSLPVHSYSYRNNGKHQREMKILLPLHITSGGTMRLGGGGGGLEGLRWGVEGD